MLKQIIIAVLSFLIIDIAWIQLVVNTQYKKILSENLLLKQPNLIPAIIFYLIFCLSLWFLIIKNHDNNLQKTLLNALVFGIATYATYSFTNLAIIDGWNWKIAVADTLWGGALAVLVCYIVLLFE